MKDKEITLETYQTFVEDLCIYPDNHKIIYPALGLSGETGEYNEKIKKWLRGDGELNKEEALKELGDCLFYIAASAKDLGFTLSDVAKINIDKLKSRQERGVIHGSGDNR